MKTEYENKQLKLNTNLAGHAKNAIIKIKVDKEGTPIERFWRNRVNDSKKDSCVEFVESAKSVVPVDKPAGKRKGKTAFKTAGKNESAE